MFQLISAILDLLSPLSTNRKPPREELPRWKRWIQNIIITFVSIIIIFAIYAIAAFFYNKSRLKSDGVQTNAYIYEEKRTSSNKLNKYYRYVWKGSLYYSMFSENIGSQRGDSICIFLLPDSPGVSMLCEELYPQ